jgi:hypothetical protein
LNGVGLCADASALPIRSGSLDAVTFHSVLYLLPDQPMALRETARVLRSGGRAVLLEPQAGKRATIFGLARALRSPRWAVTAAFWRVMSGLYGRPSAQSLWSALERGGLRVLKIEETLGGSGSWRWRRSRRSPPDPHVQLRAGARPLRDFGPLRRSPPRAVERAGRKYDDAPGRSPDRARRGRCADWWSARRPDPARMERVPSRRGAQPLGDRLVCIPGNHDRYPLDGRPSSLYETYFPPRALPDGFAALDSCGAICWPVITQGRIVEADLAQDFRGKVVLVHHAPFRSGGVPDWPWHRLRGAPRLLAAAREAAAILCGHIHERFQERNVICAGSSTERRKEGYWLIELAPGTPGPALRAAQYRPGAALVAASAPDL